MKRNVGRPPIEPSKDFSTITLRVPAEFKKRLMAQAAAYDMTLTEYLRTLVERDGA
jgi:predicted HicB family RNase H-like nuclease